MTWTRETMAGRSYTLMSLGFPLTKACSVLCLELGLSSSPLPQVRFFHGLWLLNFTTISGSVSINFIFDIINSFIFCSNHRHGLVGNVQCSSSWRHQLGSNCPVCSDKLCVGIRLLLLLYTDQRPTMGVEHYSHLIAVLWWAFRHERTLYVRREGNRASVFWMWLQCQIWPSVYIWFL